MTKEEILGRLSVIGKEISRLFGEISAECGETDSRAWLRFVKNEPRAGSELKKMPKKFYTFRARRRQNTTKKRLPPRTGKPLYRKNLPAF